MKPEDRRRWQDAVLDEVLKAIACSKSLTDILVFKGARILAQHVPQAKRQSLDLDANCSKEFLARYPDVKERAQVLYKFLSTALTDYFEAQSPVRYTLESLRVDPQPPKGHPLGWNAFVVRLRIMDLAHAGTRGLPTLEIDLVYPEELSEHSTTIIHVNGQPICVYSLERIAGEKLRAFLSSLPTHQKKTGRTGGSIRVKDIHDVARIVAHCPLSEKEFWRRVGEEFRLACRSRGVDCLGWRSFEESFNVSSATYRNEPTLPADLSFEDAWASVRSVVARIESFGLLPFEFPSPEPTEPGSH